jgi:hypothetical protein
VAAPASTMTPPSSIPSIATPAAITVTANTCSTQSQ